MPQIIRRHPHVAFACALYIAVVGFYSAAAAWYPMAYIWATYEDFVGEWIQFWSIVVAFAVSVRLAVSRWRYRWFFVLLALSCFYVAMEEISWGQRIVEFSSPEFFRTNNLQGETNIHNFLTGPFGTSLKAALSYSLAGALALYGLVYPVVLRLRLRLAVWLDSRGLAPGFCRRVDTVLVDRGRVRGLGTASGIAMAIPMVLRSLGPELLLRGDGGNILGPADR